MDLQEKIHLSVIRIKTNRLQIKVYGKHQNTLLEINWLFWKTI
jgi:hypothetical protein